MAAKVGEKNWPYLSGHFQRSLVSLTNGMLTPDLALRVKTSSYGGNALN
jgi:hypothetical protein